MPPLPGPAQWWRYRGDIFDLWQQGHGALESVTEHVNSLYPTVKFELVYSENKLNVLHVTASFSFMVLFKLVLDIYISPQTPHHPLQRPC